MANKVLTINMKLEGYENIKTQLNDIEYQLDRIADKQGCGKQLLITKEEAFNEYINNCIEYVNEEIHKANVNLENSVDLRLRRIPNEVMSMIQIRYNVVIKGDKYITIAW